MVREDGGRPAGEDRAAGAAPWHPAAGQPPGGTVPPPLSGTAPVTPLPSVGPQAWLAEAVRSTPDAAEAGAQPAAPPPASPPPWPTRQQPAAGAHPWQEPAAGAHPWQQPAAEHPWRAPAAAPPDIEGGRRRPLGLALAGALVLALVVIGGLALAGQLSSSTETATGTGTPAEVAAGDSADTAGAAGPVQPVAVRATCQAPPSADSTGAPVTYEPELTLDGVPATAWRCPGAAVGQQLVYDFGAPVTLTSVGLVPGYAKVDPADGSDRFLENRTVTEVTWRFDDGSMQRQSIPSPTPAAAQLQLPGGVTTQQVVLEIAGTGNDAAIRNFTAVSDVQFTGD
ncbi:discoidin domain-containing protein [Blastococcus xanthinilyticus]|nr:discoidin domain-containing protein [Blastococcus xanthinilyticus]